MTLEEAGALLAADERYADVVRPYLVGDDITEEPRQRPRRYVIDFGVRPLEDAMKYPLALDLVRRKVKPLRDHNNRPARRRRWWLFGELAVGMRSALAPLSRYIAGNAQGKRFLFCWADAETCPSNLTNVFAFEDDYSMGILSSSVHVTWATHQSSTLRVDPRYTPTSAFGTFPWPSPTAEQRTAIGTVAVELIELRQSICVDQEIGLTLVYNQMAEGAWTELRSLHRRLDETVATAYGWPASVLAAPLDVVARLSGLNTRIAAGEIGYEPFRAG